MDDFESPLDKIIREAREKGEFADLRGKGKPLQWEDESQVPEDMRTANRVIKNSGFTLSWIELGQEIDGQYEKICEELKRARAQRAEGKLDERGWQAAQDHFREQVRALNKRITGFNMKVPSDQFQRLPYSSDPDRIV